MSAFTQPIRVMPVYQALGEAGLRWERSDEKSWVLLSPNFAYEVKCLGSGDLIEIPCEFITDFASIPRLLQGLISPSGAHAGAAILHDFLYRSKDQRWRGRKDVDRIFLEAMTVSGVPYWRTQIIYLAVRIGAWAAWSASGKNPPPITLSELKELRRKGK